MRKDVQNIFFETAHQKQVMMFSATMGGDMRATCKKFMSNPFEVFIDDESKLTLHGLKQYYVKLDEKAKTLKLTGLLDALQFNQIIIFVSSAERARALSGLLKENGFPSEAVSARLKQPERYSKQGNTIELRSTNDSRNRNSEFWLQLKFSEEALISKELTL